MNASFRTGAREGLRAFLLHLRGVVIWRCENQQQILNRPLRAALAFVTVAVVRTHPRPPFNGKCAMDKDHRPEGFATKALEPGWSVWRRDENGNHFLVKDGLTEPDALLLVREYEQKGHKQFYWAEPIRGCPPRTAGG